MRFKILSYRNLEVLGTLLINIFWNLDSNMIDIYFGFYNNLNRLKKIYNFIELGNQFK